MLKIQFAVLVVLSLINLVPALGAGEYLPESEAHRAAWAASFGLASYEEASLAIPDLVAKTKEDEKMNIGRVIPADVLKNPAGNGPAHYKDWAGSLFIGPWAMDVANNDRATFYFISSDGNMVKGKLPNPFPEDQKDNKAQKWETKNYIKFTNPVTKRVTFLNLEHQQVLPEEGNPLKVERALTAEMDDLKGKYIEIKVEGDLGTEHRELAHRVLAGNLESVLRKLIDGEISPEAAGFAVEAVEKIKNRSQALDYSLDKLKKEAKKAKGAN